MPGGWHYMQKLSSGQSVRIAAFSFEELLTNMLSFRRNHMDLCGADSASIESVRADLKTYLCANFRQNCADSWSPLAVTGGIGNRADYVRPLDRVGQWIADLGNTQIDKVDYAVAGHRAEVCVQCPMNIQWQSQCMPCNDNVLVQVQRTKGSLYTPLDRRLHMCRIYGHINEVAIWLTDTHSTSKETPPPHCWKA
jgi:hypothetical protein